MGRLIKISNSPNKFNFKGSLDERIAVEHFTQSINYSETVRVEKHVHDFCELVFLKSGLCEHTFKGITATLMSNDVLLVMPDQVHEYLFSEKIEIYNCQFFLDELHGVFLDIVNKLSLPNLRSSANEHANVNSAEIPQFLASEQPPTLRFAPLNLQGIIHTSFSQASYLESLFKKIMTEQLNRPMRYMYVVKNSFEEVLIVLERIMTNQFKYDNEIPQKHKAIIEDVLQYIDTNYQNYLDFNQIASAQNLSPNYFRKIFSNYTGTSPITHLNRVRVLKAFELLRDYNCSISDVAAHVGIYDANYFTRLFKKFIGYPPSHFAQK